MKKLSLVVFLIVIFIPSLVLADEEYGGLLDNKCPDVIHTDDIIENPCALTDGNNNTTTKLYGNSGNPNYIFFDLQANYNIYEIQNRWFNGSARLTFYDHEMNIVDTFFMTDLSPSTYGTNINPYINEVSINNVRYIKLENESNFSKHKIIYTFNVKGELIQEPENPEPEPDPDPEPEPDSEPEPDPPDYNDLEVSNLSYVADETSITLNYQYSSSLSHVKIYRDDELIADQYTDRTYIDSGLGNGQTYIYRITTVDQYGNESQGKSITVTTTAIPSPPANVTVTAMNEALRVNWKKNSETNVTGYNIYMDGSKVNQQLISTNSYVIDGLENGQTYAISVTALNNNGKESDHSTISLGTPNEKGMATVKLPFSLNALSISIANWFGSLWEVIAFCVSIPLAFYLGHKVKELIVT